MGRSKLENNISAQLRRRRFHFFIELVQQVGTPLRILDLGGTEAFWRSMSFPADHSVHITLLNTFEQEVSNSFFASVAGDARDLSTYGDKAFDIVFSNSVIEHVGSFSDQERMAKEIQRVGRTWFVQTPNKYFFYETHFRLPFFHYLPLEMRAWILKKQLVRRFGPHTYAGARKALDRVNLLTRTGMKELFPSSDILVERILGIPKSLIARSPIDNASP